MIQIDLINIIHYILVQISWHGFSLLFDLNLPLFGLFSPVLKLDRRRLKLNPRQWRNINVKDMHYMYSLCLGPEWRSGKRPASVSNEGVDGSTASLLPVSWYFKP